LFQIQRIWNHLPVSLRLHPLGSLYGRHLSALVRFHAERRQYVATFFLRNRPELELMRRLADKKVYGSDLNISVLACSKGAEVYSILWTIRSARPDLRVATHAIDISREILDFAERGVYSLESDTMPAHDRVGERGVVSRNTFRDQNAPIFERLTDKEMELMFEVGGGLAQVRSGLKEGITWLHGDAGDPELCGALAPQDIVVANRFLCHMESTAAEKCLLNIGRLVKPGGYLFVSGIDLDVRTKVALSMGWKPVTDLMREIHEGDISLRHGWPLEYWGLEPIFGSRPDWKVRYSSVFQIGATS
jgi:chemotaxis protein methyltransferase CheR